MTEKSKKVAQRFEAIPWRARKSDCQKKKAQRAERDTDLPVSFVPGDFRHALSKKKIERCCQGYIAGRGRKEGFLP